MDGSVLYDDSDISNDQRNIIKKKNLKRIIDFTSFQKKMLAEAVKNQPAIWKLECKEYTNKSAVQQSWEKVSQAIGKPAADCKQAFTSMKDSFKYHQRVAAKRASGSSGGVEIENPYVQDNENPYEFAEDLSFLPDTSKKRKTFSTMELRDEQWTENSNSSSKNYFYENYKEKNVKPATDKTEDLFLDILQIQKSVLTMAESKKKEDKKLSYGGFWSYVDELVSDMSKTEVISLQEQILSIVYAKINEKCETV